MTNPFTMIDLFAGIGVASLAAEKVWGEVQHEFVEINPFCQTILKKHFPNSPIHNDIRTYRPAGTVDIVWGSPPCQAASAAGKRKGTEDARWLWPDTFRVIREAQPKYWVLENVYGLLNLQDGVVFDSLLSEMGELGYEVQSFVIPARAVNAPHRRDRIWIVGHIADTKSELCQRSEQRGDRTGQPKEEAGNGDCDASDPESIRGWSLQGRTRKQEKIRDKGCDRDAPDTDNERLQGIRQTGNEDSNRTKHANQQFDGCGGSWCEPWYEVATRLCRMDDGPSRRLYRLANGKTITAAGLRIERLKALGNSLVYPLVVKIFEAIKHAERTNQNITTLA